MTVDEAHAILHRNCSLDVGKFYGAQKNLSLGAGLVYESVRCPVFDINEKLFMTVESVAYVLTHECDVDPANNRAFNDYVTICPLIPIADFITEYEVEFQDFARLNNFLVAVARREVSRVVYIPPGPKPLNYGAFAYLNNLASTHVSAFENVPPLAAVSAYGLQEFDQALTNHLLRPKSDWLSFTH